MDIRRNKLVTGLTMGLVPAVILFVILLLVDMSFARSLISALIVWGASVAGYFYRTRRL